MSRATLPKRYAKSYGTLITDFTTVPVTATAGTFTQPATSAEYTDTTHYISGDGACWCKVAVGDTLGVLKFNSPIDLSQADYIDIWIYDASGNGAADLRSDASIIFRGITDAYPTSTNKYRWLSTTVDSYFAGSFDGKWVMVRLLVSAHLDNGSPAGLDAIQWFQIDFDNRPGSTESEFWIDSIYAGQRSRPKVVFMFDDGSESDYQFDDTANGEANSGAFEYLYTNYGKLGTSFIIPDSLGAGTAMTLSMAQTMYASGWDIANHSYSSSDLTGEATVAAAVAQVDDARDFLRANGMPEASEYLAFPGNATSDELNKALKAAGYTFGRVGQKATDTFPPSIGHPDSPSLPPFDLINFPLTATLTQTNYDAGAGSGAELKAYMLDAAKQGAAITVLTHRLVASGGTSPTVNATSFREFVDWAVAKEKEGLWDIVSLRQYLEGLDYSRVTTSARALVASVLFMFMLVDYVDYEPIADYGDPQDRVVDYVS